MIPGLDFVAIDVETADSGYPESICQMGLAIVSDGVVNDLIVKLVKPNVPFGLWQSINLAIKESDLENAAPFAEVASQISELMVGPVFSHTSYDHHAINRACSICGHKFDRALWLDSAQVARRAWPDRYAKTGYRLANIASDLGIEFRHHDAGEDARVVAEIVIRASADASLDVQGWAERVRKPIYSTSNQKSMLRRDGNVDGPLYGEVVVLTGGFDVSKEQQADLAAFAGCEVATSVTKKTTLLVVGDNRFSRGERSGKWHRAEELITQGQAIRILSESEFRRLIAEE